MQMQIDPVDTTAHKMRRLTQGLAAPGGHFTFQTWLQSPDGLWGFFSTPYVNGLRNENFAMKLPPWPGRSLAKGLDPFARANFINYSINVPPAPGGAYARARFGYAENGPVTSLFRTSRQEAYWTEIPSKSPTDPFAFASETTNHLSCSTPCTVTIPAIPGRVLYYVIDRLNSSGAVISTSPRAAAMIP